MWSGLFSDGELGTTKTGGVRNVDVSPELALAITELCRKRKAHAVKSGSGAVSDLVSINRAGNAMDLSRVRKRFIRVLNNVFVCASREPWEMRVGRIFTAMIET